MANYVFYDFETDSSNKFFGQIIEIGAILVNDDLEELDRFESRCRLSPGIIPEAMALLVNKTTPKMLKETNLSHYEMIRQFIKKLKDWGKAVYIGFNNLEFDRAFLHSTLFKNLEYPYLTSTNGNSEGDLLGLSRAANLYYPKTLKNKTNSKGNLEYKLQTMAPLNGIQHENAHSAIGDVVATLGVAKILKKKAPNVWKSSFLTINKDAALEIIKKELFFCANEFFYGSVRPFVQTFVCQHPIYQWPKCFDLKHDPNIYINMSIEELKIETKKNPKILRTVRHNRHPIVMNQSYSNFFDEYKILGNQKLIERAKIIKNNKKFSEKIETILREEAEEKEQTKSQEDLFHEETIYKKFTTPEDNRIMPEFHKAPWENRLSVINKFKDERLNYFGKKLIYEERPELLPKEDYKKIHRDFAKKVLSTNDEKWNTIPRTFSEIDTLRNKFENDEEKLKNLEDINDYIQELEKNYQSA